MAQVHDYFVCENCQNKDFKRVYNFSIRLHGVNFSNQLIYEKLTDERYQCTQCNRIFTIEQIQAKLDEFKRRRKGEM